MNRQDSSSSPSPTASPPGSPTLELLGGGELLWRPRPGFGQYLRACRERARLSLRDAAAELDVSFTRLQKMETGGRYRAPSLSFLARLSLVYGVLNSEMLREAGFDFSTDETLRVEVDPVVEFQSIVLHPTLLPLGMDEEWCESFSPRQKAQWVEFAYKLEAQLRQDPSFASKVLSEGANAPTDEEFAKMDPETLGLKILEGTIIGGALLYWQHTESFGPYLRKLREKKKINLRNASASLGLNYSMLQRMEVGEPVPPSIELLRGIAYLYGVHLEEVMREAGVNERAMSVLYRMEAWNRSFVSLVTHPLLRPVGMTPRWMQSFSSVQQSQWVIFAHRLEQHLQEGGPSLDGIVIGTRRYLESQSQEPEGEGA